MAKSNIKIIRWGFGIIKKYGLPLLLGFVFAIICYIILGKMMEPVSSSSYCGSTCHEMNTAYQSWQLSVHGANKYGFRVECIDCHLPPKEDYFSHILAKMYAGTKDVYKHHFGKEYNVEETRTKVLEHLPRQRCLHCHDDLLNKTSNQTARETHTFVLNDPEAAEYKCTECHENVGHERQSKLFQPEN